MEYEHDRSEAESAYLGLLDAAAAWSQLAGNTELAEQIDKVKAARDTKRLETARVVVAASLRELLGQDEARPGTAGAVRLNSKKREELCTGLRQLKRRVNVVDGVRHLPDEDIEYEMRRSCDVTTAQELARRIGCRAVAEVLADAKISSVRERCHTWWFVLPRCFDLLGVDETATAGDARAAGAGTADQSTAAPALAGTAFEIAADYLHVTDKKTGTVYSDYGSVTQIALEYMVKECPDISHRKKGSAILDAVRRIYKERGGSELGGYDGVVHLFRVSTGGGMNRKKTQPFYRKLVRNNGRDSMYWLEVKAAP